MSFPRTRRPARMPVHPDVMLHDKGLSTDFDDKTRTTPGRPSIPALARNSTACESGRSAAV